MATKGQTCLAGKSNGNTCGKSLAKIVARATGWTRKWEIAGKSEPRRHIAGPHDIVCSRWLAQAASEIVLYAWEMNIFQPMILAENDQIPIQKFRRQLPSSCAFFGCALCLSARLEYCAALGDTKSFEQFFCQGSCPPARQEIRSIFAKISLIFGENRPCFLTGIGGNQKLMWVVLTGKACSVLKLLVCHQQRDC